MRNAWFAEAVHALQQSGLKYVDVGARGGLPPHWQAYSALLDVAAFEPDHDEAQSLRRRFELSRERGTVYEVALSAAKNTEALHITVNPGCTSLLRPNAPLISEFPYAGRYAVERVVDVPTDSLDSTLGSDAPAQATFVKIDAQGAALAILTGATKSLEHTIALEIEVEFAPIYEDEPLFGDVDRFLLDRDFCLVDIRPTYWRHAAASELPGTRGRLIFADTLYIRSVQGLVALLETVSDDVAQQVCASVLITCDVYRLPDWVVAYAAAARTARVSESKVALLASAAEAYSREARRSFPQVPLRHRLGLILKDFGDALLESAGHWANAEQRIGGRMRLGRHSALARFIVSKSQTS